MPKLRLAFLACLLPFAALGALAQTTVRVPADQPTIQAGINAANNGDTVLVAPGAYFENIDFKGKAITVTSSDGAAKTVIDGGNKGPTVTFANGEPRAATLSSFTITHGTASSTSFGFGGGGGIVVSNSLPTILNNIISQNYCQGISVSSAAPLIQGNTISSSLTPEKCSVETTGGIYIGNPYTHGAGPYQSAQIIGNTIENNTTGEQGDGGGDGGAGIAVWGGSPLIQGNIIRNNTTHSGSGGGIYVIFGGSLSIVDNLIYGNFAGCGGGGIAAWSTQGISFTNLIIANNTLADNTGGTTPEYTDCTKAAQLWNNFDMSNPSIKFVNNIISGAASYPAFVCGVPYYSSAGQPSEELQSLFDHNLLYNGGAPFLGGPCVDITNLHGNISVDPQFVNATGHDYHLRNTSPAVDSGNGSVLQMLHDFSGVTLSKDLDGNPREQDATGKGLPIIDMGAYEFSGTQDAAPTRVVLSSSAYTGAAGSNFVLTASLSSSLGSPTGSATFFRDYQQIGTAAITGGVATLNNVAFTPGVHVLHATYDGQGSFQPAISVIIIVALDKYADNLQLTSSANPSLVGQSVTFSVHASSADANYIPTPIPLVDSSTNSTLATLTPDAAGNASFSTSTLALGYHSITASYAGDSTHASASAAVFQQVISGYATGTGLTSSLNPSRLNQSVTFTAHVTSSSSTPTGSVTFTDGYSTLGSQPLDASGNAALSTAALTAGPHTITATYLPTGTFAGSSSSLTQQVNGLPTASTLSVSTTGPYSGNVVSLTANITSTSPGTITGTVTFYADGLALAGPVGVANDAAMLSTSSMRPGTHTLTCTYSGDSTFSSSTCPPVSLVISSIPTSMTLATSGSPAPALSPVTFTANLTSQGKPFNGAVLFYVNGNYQKAVSPDANGNATFILPFATGSYLVNAQFPGNDGTDASYASITQVAVPNPTTTMLAPPTGPIYQNQPATFAITVAAVTGTSSPNGIVSLYEGSTLLGSTTTQPSASGKVLATVHIPATLLSGGAHVLNAVYTPDVNFVGSTSTPLSITVAPQTFTLTLSAPSMSVQIEHHIAFSASVQSVGGFTGPVQLTCAPPPDIFFTCDIAASQLQLAANGTATSEFVLDTDAVLRFKSSLENAEPLSPGSAPAFGTGSGSGAAPGSGTAPGSGREVGTLAFAVLLPLSLLGFARRRRSNLPTLLAIAFLAATVCVTGCSSKYPAHTPPGTYDIPITATGTSAGSTAAVTQTIHLSITVTP